MREQKKEKIVERRNRKRKEEKWDKKEERGFKDIVPSKKRGVERGTIRTVLTSYTIADIF
jgi:hypothetical protein